MALSRNFIVLARFVSPTSTPSRSPIDRLKGSNAAEACQAVVSSLTKKSKSLAPSLYSTREEYTAPVTANTDTLVGTNPFRMAFNAITFSTPLTFCTMMSLDTLIPVRMTPGKIRFVILLVETRTVTAPAGRKANDGFCWPNPSHEIPHKDAIKSATILTLRITLFLFVLYTLY